MALTRDGLQCTSYGHYKSCRLSHRKLGISYNAAWRMHYKRMQVMLEREVTPIHSAE